MYHNLIKIRIFLSASGFDTGLEGHLWESVWLWSDCMYVLNEN